MAARSRSRRNASRVRLRSRKTLRPYCRNIAGLAITGGSAFPLTTFKQASARAESIAEVITDQRMPPWFASHEFGPFVNRRALSDDEKQTLLDWVRGGVAPKRTEDAGPAQAADKWLIGSPDLF